MAEIVKETVTSQQEGPKKAIVVETKRVATPIQIIQYLVYFFFTALLILLTFRLALMLTGANPASGFVTLVYGITGMFILPFEGIFSPATSPGLETRAVFEPATLVAMVVYAVLAWGIGKLLQIFSGEKQAIE